MVRICLAGCAGEKLDTIDQERFYRLAASRFTIFTGWEQRAVADTLHSSVADNDGSNGEFQLTGYANRVHDAGARQQAIALAPYETAARYILFELGIVEALSTVYRDEGAVRTKWKPFSR